ncbi:hypothetical protein [Actinoplanes sp. HUAS TT8]|uniref:hypothetical protein n=1 Tax=Actinoplanes sp. HUAS TT8 TaxID=3447453 RepID=UPI003F51AEC6
MRNLLKTILRRAAVLVAVLTVGLAGTAIPAAAATIVNKACFYSVDNVGPDGNYLVRYCTRATWTATSNGRHLTLRVSIALNGQWPVNAEPYDCAYTMYGKYSNPAGSEWAITPAGKNCSPAVGQIPPGLTSYYTWLSTDTSADSVVMGACLYLYDANHNIGTTWCGGAPAWTTAYADRDLGWLPVYLH